MRTSANGQHHPARTPVRSAASPRAGRAAARLLWALLALALGCSPARADQHILISARINGQPVRLAFDTGSDDFVIWREAAKRLGLRFTPPEAGVQAAPGEIVAGHTNRVTFEVFGKTVRRLRLAVIDGGPELSPTFDGVIGWTNVRNNIWSIDGAALKLGTLDAPPADTAGWTRLRERRDWRVLCLELPQSSSARRAYIGVDTGDSAGVRLFPEQWAQWRSAHPGQPVTLVAAYMPGAGITVKEEAWADEIELCGLTLRGVPVMGVNTVETFRLPKGTVAVLGLAAIRRTKFIFGGRDGIAYMLPLFGKAPPYRHNRLGAVFVPEGAQGTDLVAHVAAGSPAAAAGIVKGDVLLGVGPLDVTAWRTQPGILPLSRFWQQEPGTILHLTLRRAGAVFTTDAVLRDILIPAHPDAP